MPGDAIEAESMSGLDIRAKMLCREMEPMAARP